MNSTNRALNRILVLVVGIAALVLGAGVLAWTLLPGVQELWGRVTPDAAGYVAQGLRFTEIGDTGVSAVTVGLLVLLAVFVVLLCVFIVRQGNGHTSVLVRETFRGDSKGDAVEALAGSIVIDSAVGESLLSEVLHARNEFVSTRVSTYAVRGTPTMKVSVTCRRGVSPREAATIVEEAVLALDKSLGRSLPTLVHIAGGFRSTLAKASRVA